MKRRTKRRPHPMNLFAITCDLNADADIYGWCPTSSTTVCEYCEDQSPTAICGQCRDDLGIPTWVIT